MAFQSIAMKLVEVFCAFIAIFTSIYPGSAVKTNPAPERAEGTDIRVVTFNLRYTGTGKTSVAFREKLLIPQLKEYNPDSMGFQEATVEWMGFLRNGFKDYGYVGRHRDDGMLKGEANPIFYRKDKYDLIDYDTFWLSKTPDKAGSSDWNSGSVRICTYAVLENKETKERYVHFNTHLDNSSTQARTEQIKIVLNKVNEFIDKYPVVLTGDFNTGRYSSVYNATSLVLNDTCLNAPIAKDMYTYHDYGNADYLLDYIFVNDKIDPLVYHVIDDKILDTYLSDHYGIYVDLKFK